MSIGTAPSAADPACPACGSRRVAPGAIRSHGGNALSFSLLDLHVDTRKFTPRYPTLQVEQPVWFCVGCGLLWASSTDLAEARRQIRAHGSEALKARTLEDAESLPRPAVAPGSEEQSLPRPSIHLDPQ